MGMPLIELNRAETETSFVDMPCLHPYGSARLFERERGKLRNTSREMLGNGRSFQAVNVVPCQRPTKAMRL